MSADLRALIDEMRREARVENQMPSTSDPESEPVCLTDPRMLLAWVDRLETAISAPPVDLRPWVLHKASAALAVCALQGQREEQELDTRVGGE